jgi:hypothetical protein
LSIWWPVSLIFFNFYTLTLLELEWSFIL